MGYKWSPVSLKPSVFYMIHYCAPFYPTATGSFPSSARISVQIRLNRFGLLFIYFNVWNWTFMCCYESFTLSLKCWKYLTKIFISGKFIILTGEGFCANAENILNIMDIKGESGSYFSPEHLCSLPCIMNLQEEKLWGEELERRLPKIRRSFTITEKVPAWAFSWLKVPLGLSHLRQY